MADGPNYAFDGPWGTRAGHPETGPDVRWGVSMGYYCCLYFLFPTFPFLAPGCLNITVLTQYFAIYDADGSLAGELSYALGKLAGARRCALCDISHGWNPQGKAAWRAGSQLACGLQWLHRDEQTPAMAAYTRDRLPLVIAQTGDRFTTLLDADGLAACDGDYEAFTAALGAVITPGTVTAGTTPGSGTAAAGVTGS